MSMLRNRTLWLTGLAASVLGTVGCGGGSDNTAFVAQWDLFLAGTGDTQRISCQDASTPKVQMDITGITGSSSAVNMTFKRTFDCAVGTGQSDPLPAGMYMVTVSLLNDLGQPVDALTGTFDLNRHGSPFLEPVQFEVNRFSVSWKVTKGGAPAQCNDVGAKTVRISASLADAAPMTFDFPCSAYSGVTPAIAPSDPQSYVVKLLLLGPGGNTLSNLQLDPIDVTSDKAANLPLATFAVP